MRASRVAKIDISAIRRMFELAGGDVVNLAIGEPDFPMPGEAREAMKKALSDDQTHYTSNKGIVELREALAQKLAEENGIRAHREELVVTAGASEALHLAFEAFVEPGDEVLMPDPGFISYPALAKLAQGKEVYYNLGREDGFLPSEEDVKEKLTHRTKLLVLNSPANPTGAVCPGETIRALAEAAEDSKALVLSDEVYEKIIYGGEHHSPGAYSQNVITVGGFSKSYAMTGLRVGYLHSREELVEEMLKVHQYIQACTSSLSQHAALGALKSVGFVEKMVEVFMGRRELLCRLLEGIEGVEFVKPHGAFYLFADFSSYSGSRELAMELVKAGVLLTPGSAFGKAGEGFLRFSYATSEQNIKEGLARIKGYLEER